jgi:hypothetical protein
MEVTCLSVPNPRSYLLCAGIADVENRGFTTDYRGTIYIHSTGRRPISGMPDMKDYPVPVIHEFDEILSRIQNLDYDAVYVTIPDKGVRIALRDEERQSEQAVAEYSLLSDVYRAYREDPKQPFFLVNAIIGTVELVDVVDNSESLWAQKGYVHWVVRNATLFDEPIGGVMTSRSGLWKHELDSECKRGDPE